ncbi:hypothetical protein Moror_14499 [Moniliophthora roreri MCA 2997]|uniref:Uncharacterized protein n=2 Tax=Moniliophthora roreri TaxID=221103 RepID=V2XLI1_MONRO|nr:hypothetical protein Moror_14499 [Moniliophthora roreri MCA 2997]KAI3614168.1 hypothetical protein WG66_000132 [Moniliophthora roreri]
MSVMTPTVLPRPQVFPRLLPHLPQPHVLPLPNSTKGNYGKMKERRDLQREMNELSDEEKELEDINISIRNKGYSYMIPIGRTLTIQEEKNDAEDESEGASSSSESGNGPPSGLEDEADNESTQDLDADMEDLDEDGDGSEDNGMEEGDTEEYEEGPSDM